MKRISQKEVVSRIYKFRRSEWLKTNTEELTTGEVKFIDGVRNEQSLTGEFKPYHQFKRFDAGVSIHYLIKRDVMAGKRIIEPVLNNDYYVVKGEKYYGN